MAIDVSLPVASRVRGAVRPASQNRRRQMPRWLAAAALAPALVSAALTWLRIGRAVPVPYELGYGEGLVIWLAEHMLHPATVYRSVATSPFVAGLYPPVHLLAVFAAGRIVGNFQLGGRLVGALAAAGLLAAMSAIAVRVVPARFGARARWSAGLAAAALAACTGTIGGFAPAVRVDGLAVCLSMVGMAFFLARIERTWRHEAAALCFVLAVFTKQNLIAAPAACVITASLVDVRSGLRLAATLIVLGLVPLVLLLVLTHGWFLTSLLVYPQGAFSLSALKALLVENLRQVTPILVLALAACGIAAAGWRRGRDAWMSRLRISHLRFALVALLTYMAIAFLVSFAAGKALAGAYYFMEWNAVCALLAAIVWGLAVGRWRARPLRPALVSAACALALYGGLALAEGANQALMLGASARAFQSARLDEYREAEAFVSRTPGPIFSDDLTLLVNAGKDIVLEPSIIYQLDRWGRWNDAPFVQSLAARRYAALVTVSDVDADPSIPERIRRAMSAAYRLRMRIGHYRIYVPRT